LDPTAHQTVTLNGGADLQGFRQALRILIWSLITPEQITWKTHAGVDCFGDQAPAPYGEAGKPIILPRTVSNLIEHVVCHSDPRKYELLYELVWRMKGPHEPDPYAFARPKDDLVQALERMKEDVAEDIRRMRERVRFQEMHDRVAGNRFIAWFEPEHFIIEMAAPVFIDRFGSIDWTILTPKGCLWWDRKELAIGLPASRKDVLEAEAACVKWRPHRASVFNPARTEMADTRWRRQTRHWTQTAAG
jgi:DNA polymerase